MSNPVADARVLLFDTESTPITGYVWRPYDTNLIDIAEGGDWRFLSVAWKWLGERPIHFASTEGDSDDYNMLSELREVLNEANVVIGHNGVSHDVKKVNARLAYWGIDPPSPYKTLDTLLVARKHFAFTYNSLDKLCNYLGLGGKVHHQGFGLWLRCMADDPVAWRTMRRYNIHDVRLLERLYLHLLPYMERHPNLAMLASKPDACPHCLAPGSALIVRGYRMAQVTMRVQYQCNKCRAYCADRKVIKAKATHVTHVS